MSPQGTDDEPSASGAVTAPEEPDGERDGEQAAADRTERSFGRTVTTREPGDDVVHPADVEREFGWRGYVLLAALVLALVVAPVVVALRPPALPWYVSLVLFPLLPALLLGVVAVWATTRP